jgi:hypothetical protein
MMLTMVDTRAKDRWRLRLRRAFNIPDIVSDEAANRVIANKAAQQVDVVLDRQTYPAAVAAVKLVIDCGADAQLDEMFFDQPEGEALRDADDPKDILSRIEAAMEQQVGRDAVFPGWWRLIENLLDRVQAHVKEHPYEDALGRYFD